LRCASKIFGITSFFFGPITTLTYSVHQKDGDVDIIHSFIKRTTNGTRDNLGVVDPLGTVQLRGVTNETANDVSLSNQARNETSTDVTRRSGYEDTTHRWLNAHMWPA
jgi:hypothetical protein